MLVGVAVVVLSLDEVAAEHLWVLDFDLRIVEDVVVVVDIFDYLNWLLLVLLLRLRRPTSPRVWTMEASTVRLLTWEHLIVLHSHMRLLVHGEVV